MDLIKTILPLCFLPALAGTFHGMALFAKRKKGHVEAGMAALGGLIIVLHSVWIIAQADHPWSLPARFLLAFLSYIVAGALFYWRRAYRKDFIPRQNWED